jgi:hypothetical protein
MNERIQQLVKRASTTTTSYYDGRGNVTETYFDKEKFADSIVWECMKICEDVMKKDNSALACWSEIKRTFRS